MTTAQYIRQVLSYDPETGQFVWREGKTKGRIAGCIAKDGYRVISVCRRMYYAHRLAWLHVTGAWPEHQIDHRDGEKDNNAFANLREATPSENAQNRIAYRTNKSGFQGVSVLRDGRYVAQIMEKGRHYRLGCTNTAEEAHALYLRAKAKIHKFQPEPRAV